MKNHERYVGHIYLIDRSLKILPANRVDELTMGRFNTHNQCQQLSIYAVDSYSFDSLNIRSANTSTLTISTIK